MSPFLKGALLAFVAVTVFACGKIPKSEDDDHRSDDATPAPTETPPPAEDPPPNDEPPPELPGVASEDGAYRLNVEWIKDPDYNDEDNQCRLVFFTKEGKPATSVADAKLIPWMTSMGHGAPMIDLELAQDAGRADAVLVTGLIFTMGGTWDLKVEATVDGVSDDAVFAVDVPK